MRKTTLCVLFLFFVLISPVNSSSFREIQEKRPDHPLNGYLPKIQLHKKEPPFKFEIFPLPTAVKYDDVMDLFIKKNRLYLAVKNVGIYIFENNKFSAWTQNPKLPDKEVISLCVTYEKGRDVFWLGTYENGVFRYKDGKFKNFVRPNPESNAYYGPGGTYVPSIVEDGNKIWFATGTGLTVFSRQFGWFTHRYRRQKGFYDDFCRVVAAIPMHGAKKRFESDPTEDKYKWQYGSKAGNEIWVGTLYDIGGLIQFRGKVVSRFRSANGIWGAPFVSIAGDENVIWAGTTDSGVYAIKNDHTVFHYKPENGFAGGNIAGLVHLNGHTLVSMEAEGLLHFDQSEWVQYRAKDSRIPGKLGTIKEAGGRVALLSDVGLIIIPDFKGYTEKNPVKKEAWVKKPGEAVGILSRLRKDIHGWASGFNSPDKSPFAPDYVRVPYQPRPDLKYCEVLAKNKCLECHHGSGWGWRVSFASRKVTLKYFKDFNRAMKFFRGEVKAKFPRCNVEKFSKENRLAVWRWLLGGK
ncbi:hypothetical protein ACFL35_12740 [Candidatus Riflebacteria bacterium]